MSPSVLFWQKLVAWMLPNLLKNALEIFSDLAGLVMV